MATLAISPMRDRGEYLLSAVVAMLVHGAVLAALWSVMPAKGTAYRLDQVFEMVALAPPAAAIPEPDPEPEPEPAPPVTPPEPLPVAEAPPEMPKPRKPPVQRPAPRLAEVVAEAPVVAAAPEPAPAVAESFSPPDGQVSYLHNPLPKYPRSARRRHIEGTVLLFVSVSREGTPTRVMVRNSSGFDTLDQAALDAVNRWRFEPARRNGVAVAGEVLVPVEFRLENG